MNGLDPFEAKLKKVPQRVLPHAWRAEILRAAHNAAVNRRPEPGLPLAWRFLSGLRSLLWPAPGAWAGVATAWLVIMILNLGTHEPVQANVTPQPIATSAQARAILREQEKLFAELVDLVPAPTPPDPLKPKPRGERRLEFSNA